MTILGFILGGVLLVWAVYPLFKKLGFWVSLDDSIDTLEDHKQRLYRNISDLEFDFAMGRLGEGDFSRIRNRFAKEAGPVIERLESTRDDSITAAIDRDLDKLGSGASVSEEPRRASTVKYCTECGAENESQAKFCISCGEAFA